MGKMLKTSADNRKCTFPNCENTLSIYNHQDYCHVHLDTMSIEQKHRLTIDSAVKNTAKNKNPEISNLK